jgi:alkyl hydroperoxide reductase subunit AhpF
MALAFTGGVMAILSHRDQESVRKELEKLAAPVKLTVFSQELGSDTCRQTEWLMKEVAELSDKVSVEILNLVLDRERAEAYGVDRVPAVVVEGAKDYGIRFFGLPAGYEFSNLVDAMVVASTGKPALSAETVTALAALASPVHIRVFTTPT